LLTPRTGSRERKKEKKIGGEKKKRKKPRDRGELDSRWPKEGKRKGEKTSGEEKSRTRTTFSTSTQKEKKKKGAWRGKGGEKAGSGRAYRAAGGREKRPEREPLPPHLNPGPAKGEKLWGKGRGKKRGGGSPRRLSTSAHMQGGEGNLTKRGGGGAGLVELCS